jgi:hypothetical protein
MPLDAELATAALPLRVEARMIGQAEDGGDDVLQPPRGPRPGTSLSQPILHAGHVTGGVWRVSDGSGQVWRGLGIGSGFGVLRLRTQA